MKHQRYTVFFSICLFLCGCQSSSVQISSPAPATETQIVSTSTPVDKIQTLTPSPTAGPEIIFQGSLNCTSGDETIHCIDNNINIEFEYPLRWGEVNTLLRTGWDSGYIYHYEFIKGTIAIDELPQTGGVSNNFGEGRDRSPLDFGGFGNEKYQVNSCEENDLYPICYEIKTNVAWMIRFPNAKHFCEYTHEYTSPVIRIEINLPNGKYVKGFVFEVPFLSEKMFEQVRKDVYKDFLMDDQFFPFFESCQPENRAKFDLKVLKFLDKLETNSLDVETQENLKDLLHFAESITFIGE